MAFNNCFGLLHTLKIVNKLFVEFKSLQLGVLTTT